MTIFEKTWRPVSLGSVTDESSDTLCSKWYKLCCSEQEWESLKENCFTLFAASPLEVSINGFEFSAGMKMTDSNHEKWEPLKWLEDEKNHNYAYEKQATGRTKVSKEMLPLRLREGQLSPFKKGVISYCFNAVWED